jgi:single-stranded DNA-binding protein
VSLHALAGGTLHSDPERCVGTSGKPYARATILHRDGVAVVFARVTAFGEVADQLLALHKGDAIAITGRASVRAYLDRHGEPAPSLDLLVDRLLDLKPPERKAKPKAAAPAPRAPRQPPLDADPRPLAEIPNDL